MGYKILGFVVWQGGKWWLRRRFPVLSSRKVVAGAALAAGVAGFAVAGSRGDRAQL